MTMVLLVADVSVTPAPAVACDGSAPASVMLFPLGAPLIVVAKEPPASSRIEMLSPFYMPDADFTTIDVAPVTAVENRLVCV